MAGEDPHINNVSLLMPMDGGFANAADGTLLTGSYGAAVQTAEKKYGVSAAYFSGLASTGCTCVPMPTSAVDFGTNPFTIEFWIKSLSGANNNWPSALVTTNGDRKLIIIVDGPGTSWGGIGRLRAFVAPSGGTVATMLSANAIKDSGQWHHVAVVRGDFGFNLAVDGVFASDHYTGQSIATANLDNTDSLSCVIGAHTTLGSNGDKCYIDDLRITKGVARYSADFTPPGRLVTVAYPDYSAGAAPLAGTAKKANGDPAEHVLIRAWDNRAHIIEVTPAADGAWSADVPAGSYDVTYLADGCAPICHGPYTVAEP